MLSNLPTGITQEYLDGQREWNDDKVYDLPKHEVERREAVVKMLGLSLDNPFIRMWANGKN